MFDCFCSKIGKQIYITQSHFSSAINTTFDSLQQQPRDISAQCVGFWIKVILKLRIIKRMWALLGEVVCHGPWLSLQALAECTRSMLGWSVSWYGFSSLSHRWLIGSQWRGNGLFAAHLSVGPLTLGSSSTRQSTACADVTWDQPSSLCYMGQEVLMQMCWCCQLCC